MKQRIEWIDGLRGLGICLVILGHMTIPEIVRKAIFSFHMPLFFFLSGFLFGGVFSVKWILKKADKILLPYVSYSIIMLVVLSYLGKCDFLLIGKSVLLGNGIGVTWFLTCLFMVELMGGFLVTRRVFTDLKVMKLFIVLIAFLGWWMPKLGLPVIIKSNTILAALAFWLWGYAMKNTCFNVTQLSISVVMVMLFVCQRVDMNSAQFGNGFLFYGTAMGAIVTLLWGFQRFSIQWKLLSFIGGRSLEFMCLHAFIPMVLTSLVAKSGYEVPKCVMRGVSLSAVVFAAWAIHRYSKVLSGQACMFQRLAK